jgi:hypothetical protein
MFLKPYHELHIKVIHNEIRAFFDVSLTYQRVTLPFQKLSRSFQSKLDTILANLEKQSTTTKNGLFTVPLWELGHKIHVNIFPWFIWDWQKLV